MGDEEELWDGIVSGHFSGDFPRVDSQILADLGREVSCDEIREAMFDMQPWKASGHDGF